MKTKPTLEELQAQANTWLDTMKPPLKYWDGGVEVVESATEGRLIVEALLAYAEETNTALEASEKRVEVMLDIIDAALWNAETLLMNASEHRVDFSLDEEAQWIKDTKQALADAEGE